MPAPTAALDIAGSGTVPLGPVRLGVDLVAARVAATELALMERSLKCCARSSVSPMASRRARSLQSPPLSRSSRWLEQESICQAQSSKAACALSAAPPWPPSMFS